MKNEKIIKEDAIIRIEDAIEKGDYRRALLNLDFLKDSITEQLYSEKILTLKLKAYSLALDSIIKDVEECILAKMGYSAVSLLENADMYLNKLKELGSKDVNIYSSRIDELRSLAYMLCTKHELKIVYDVLEKGDYSAVRAILSRIEKYISKIPRPTSSKIPPEIKEFKKNVRSEIETIKNEIKRRKSEMKKKKMSKN
ncbi:MAG: hypothetical protein QXJ25_01700 [Candidatus Aenigmatarchaeota archaeon]